jgi:hypothetical protein
LRAAPSCGSRSGRPPHSTTRGGRGHASRLGREEHRHRTGIRHRQYGAGRSNPTVSSTTRKPSMQSSSSWTPWASVRSDAPFPTRSNWASRAKDASRSFERRELRDVPAGVHMARRICETGEIDGQVAKHLIGDRPSCSAYLVSGSTPQA